MTIVKLLNTINKNLLKTIEKHSNKEIESIGKLLSQVTKLKSIVEKLTAQ